MLGMCFVIVFCVIHFCMCLIVGKVVIDGFGVGAAMGCQVCGFNSCCYFPLSNFVEIWVCCVGQVFGYGLVVGYSCVGV